MNAYGLGRVVRQPELKSNEHGDYCFLSLAYSKRWKDKEGNDKEKTTFISVACNKGLAKLASMFTKGEMVYFEAEIYNKKYKPEGYDKEIEMPAFKATNLQFTMSKKDKELLGKGEVDGNVTNDDIPF